MPGFATNRAALDNRMGQVIVGLQQAFAAVEAVSVMLNDPRRITDELLTGDPAGGGFGYTADEVTQIRAAFAALSSLNRISHAQAAQPQTNDFWWDARGLTGVQGLF
jgi:hypothetical protein